MNLKTGCIDIPPLPETLPIFPLEGALLLPAGHLPLNIFEPRYLSMVDAAFSEGRLIGMIQPCPAKSEEDSENNNPALYDVGCAGRITEFNEMPDGRYTISLTGVCRFRVVQEMNTDEKFRRVQPDWAAFKHDFGEQACTNLDRPHLQKLLEKYFDQEGMNCDWKILDGVPDGKLITCLSMICPFEPQEKQALLEALCCNTRAALFDTMLRMAVHGDKDCGSCH